MAVVFTPRARGRFAEKAKLAGLALLPLVLVAGVIGLFLTAGGLNLHREAASSEEVVTVEQTAVFPGQFAFVVRNMGVAPVTISGLNINDAILPFVAVPGSEIPAREKATVYVLYPWVEGDTYSVTMFTGSSTPIEAEISPAEPTVYPDGRTLVDFTLIGLYAGTVALLCAFAGVPALRLAGERTYLFPMAVTIGLLVYLALAAFQAAIRTAQEAAEIYQGIELVGMGVLLTFLFLEALRGWLNGFRRTIAGNHRRQAMAAAGEVGLHNLAIGLAIGAAFSVEETSLGVLLVIGLIVYNIFQGLRIALPVARDRPSIVLFLVWALIGGLPAILGIWIGRFLSWTPLATLYLVVGAGAMVQAAYEGYRRVRDQAGASRPFVVALGVAVGMLVLYAVRVWML